ncbi:NAD(P)-dependent oxidoreductase [Neobacillus mesonae]|nr:NAD(P)-dependent oxidoreductase [Neobacillus mesonae]
MTNNNNPSVAVGFIGLGVMGRSMAKHIQSAGYSLHVYTRTKDKAEELIHSGAQWHEGPKTLAAACNVIITMVGYPKDVEELYFGTEGLIMNAKKGAYLIDMTTSSPQLAQRIYDACKSEGIHAIDAPVSGGDIGARNAALSIMIGGIKEDVDAVYPLLTLLGKNIVYQGEAGAGQHTKMCNQIAIASNMIGVCEALAYAKHAGLDPNSVLESIESGAAGSWSLSQLGPRMIRNDFEPGFYVKHFIKDMGIALEAAKELELSTPGLSLAESLYQQLSDTGFDEKGTQSLFKLYIG